MILNFNNRRSYIIAEAGVNHNGSLITAKKLIDKAKYCNADAVKFQFFSADKISTSHAKLAPYQKKNIKKKISQNSLLKTLELKKKDFLLLKIYAQKKKIDFFLSIFDEDNLDFLVNKLKSKIIKIPSGEITNYFLLKKIDYKKNKIILSTGMSNLEEICKALNIICKDNIFLIKNKDEIVVKKYKKYKNIKDRIFLLHCVSEYPAEEKFLNLTCITTFQNKFGLKIGFSDHSKSTLSSIVAVAKGAKVIEKHFTLNNKMKGPDHSSSFTPKEFKLLIDEIRMTEIMLGSETKKIQNCEKSNMISVRKSIVAKKNKYWRKIYFTKFNCQKNHKRDFTYANL
jgi:sialic acid synthase SpsE